jgi:hypothetical protein
MPITFACSCGVTLSVPEGAPIYFVRCPKCRATTPVPQPKKRKKAEPAEEDPGFELVDETKPRSTCFDRPKKSQEDEDWEKAPYAPPQVDGGYEVGAQGPVVRGATQGAGEAEPYEVTQEEFEEEARQRRGTRSGRKLRRAIWLGIAAVVGIGAFAAAGRLTRWVDPAGNGRVGVAVARVAIVFTQLVVMLVIWLANQGGGDD